MVTRKRVHEIASEWGATPQEAMEALRELGENVKSPSSTIEPAVARKLTSILRRGHLLSAEEGIEVSWIADAIDE